MRVQATALLALLMLAVIVFAAPGTEAAVVVSNLAEPTAGGNALNLGNWWATSFTTDAFTYSLNSVDILLDSAASPLGGYFVSVHADGAGSPGAQLVNGLLVGSATPPVGTSTYTVGGPVLLNPNTTYWLVQGTTHPTALWGIAVSPSDAETGTWAIGDVEQRSVNQGATWAVFDSNVVQFSVDATAVPEPTALMVLLALGGLGLGRRRR